MKNLLALLRGLDDAGAHYWLAQDTAIDVRLESAAVTVRVAAPVTERSGGFFCVGTSLPRGS